MQTAYFQKALATLDKLRLDWCANAASGVAAT
eukprot:SAG31_NODE_33114_length_347_cov_1.508065_1_plen_31_part_10